MEVFLKHLAALKPHLEELLHLQFNFSNPLYGLLLLSALFLLARKWGMKKAFSYCLLISSTLYFATRSATFLNIPIEGSGVRYADIIRGACFFAAILITVYYFFIRNE